MTKIIVDLNDEQNRKVELHKADKSFASKDIAILDMIDKFKLNVKK